MLGCKCDDDGSKSKASKMYASAAEGIPPCPHLPCHKMVTKQKCVVEGLILGSSEVFGIQEVQPGVPHGHAERQSFIQLLVSLGAMRQTLSYPGLDADAVK